MKTGDKIVFGYLTVAALGLLFFMVSMRFIGDKTPVSIKLGKSEKQFITIPFQFVKVEKLSSVQLVESDSFKIVCEYENEEKLRNDFKYDVKNDTLVMQTTERSVNNVKIYCNKTMRYIEAYRSQINLISTLESITVVLKHSDLNDNTINDNQVQKQHIGILNVIAREQSNIYLNNMLIDSLNVIADKASFFLNSKVKSISGSIKNKTIFNHNNFSGSVSLKKDNSSTIHMGEGDE